MRKGNTKGNSKMTSLLFLLGVVCILAGGLEIRCSIMRQKMNAVICDKLWFQHKIEKTQTKDEVVAIVKQYLGETWSGLGNQQGKAINEKSNR
jgi:hypothetical protein